MKKEIVYSVPSLYRDDLRITGYSFGRGEKSVCVIGAIRGNEIQQLYVCSQLIRVLRELEQKGDISNDNEILVIPSVNHYGMNIGRRFWAADNTDINRMFPGDERGETTQRIAAGVFEKAKGYRYGIQFASFYMPGDFIPHVRMMDTGHQNTSLANLFGLPYVVVRSPKPFDTATLNYNWQMWDTNAFSVYTCATDQIDEQSARQGVSSVLRFLTRMGVIKYASHGGFMATTIKEESLMSIKTKDSGIYRLLKHPGQEVAREEPMADIIHPYEGTVISRVTAPVDGVVFFAHTAPLVIEGEVVFRIVKRFHA